jgi:hypothetical protein
MPRFRMLMMLGFAVLLFGCDDDARRFAEKTRAILDERSVQLSVKIASEKATYNKEAAVARDDHRALVDATLQNDRNERSDYLAAEYDEGRKPVSQWRMDLTQYARTDYTTNKDLLVSEIDTNSLHLQKLEDLKVEQDKVDALSKLLTSLSQKPSLKNDVGTLATFAEDTKKAFDQKVCAQLKTQKAGNDAAAKAASKSYDAKQCNEILK